MDFCILGRTGLRVSVVGLGCGGPSRLGVSQGASLADAAKVVRRALELGVTYLDTATGYGTEPAVALGIAGWPRHEIVLATKIGPAGRDGPITAAQLVAGVEASLGRLGVDVIDIYQLHGVMLDRYEHCVNELVPALQALRDQGKIRFIGLTERFGSDPGHQMLQRALRDDCWDTYMVGSNLLNPSAARTILPETARRGIGTLNMFAVRRALSRPDRLRETIAGLLADGLLAAGSVDPNDPLDFLRAPGVADSVTEAAYRFCRYTPGMDVVLTGTGSVEHLEQNLRSLAGPALPEEVLGRLEGLFGRLEGVTGE